MAENKQDSFKHGSMDITQQRRTFAGFIRLMIWSFAITFAALILLALFNHA